MATVSYLYSLPYVLVSFFLLFSYRYEIREETKKVSAQLIFIFLLFFIGLRGHLYTDYISYYSFFEYIPPFHEWVGSFDGYENFEYGFIFYTSLFKMFCPNYFAWIFFNSFLDLLVFNWFFKRYSSSVIFSYIFFIAFMGFIMETNLLRNIKAISLFLLSIPYLEKKKFFPYFMINMVGVLFHTSSLLYIVAYFFINRAYRRWLILMAFIVVNLMYVLNINVIEYMVNSVFANYSDVYVFDKLTAYQEKSSAESVLSIGYIERTISFMIFLYNYNRLTEKNNFNMIFCNCYFMYYILFYVLGFVPVLSERFSYLFIFSYWVLYPNLLSSVKSKRVLVYSIAFSFCLLKVVTLNNKVICKYDNWLLGGISSYEERKRNYMNNPELW